MKNNIKKRKLIIVALIIAFIVAPLTINILFKIQAPIGLLEAEWGAGDALSLFAAVFASICAIYGISMTINASNDDLKESIRNQALPFIIVEFLKIKPEHVEWLSTDLTEDLPDPDNGEFEEYALREFNYIISESGINITRLLNGKQLTNVKRGGIKKVSPIKGTTSIIREDFVYIHLILENVGKGAAVQTRVGLNRKSTIENERKYVYPIPLKIGDKLSVGVYADNMDEDSSILGEYDLEIFYSDMYGNKYCQQHDILLKYNDEKASPYAQISTEQNQIMLTK